MSNTTNRATSSTVHGTPLPHENDELLTLKEVAAIIRVRPTHVEAWVKEMSVRGLAPGTVKTRFVNIRSVFRAAIRDKVIAADPTEGIRLPRLRKREASMQIPTPAQVKSILEAADERFVALVAVCAFAGLRLGEAAALTFDDVDFLRRELHVRRQVQRAGAGKVEIRLPKYGSERDIPLPDELLTILSRHVDLGHRGDWLFAGAADKPPHQNTVGYWWRKTLSGAGMSGIRLHDLRHFYASGLIAAGCDVVTVQRALGMRNRARPWRPTATSGRPLRTRPDGPPLPSPRRSSPLTGAGRGQQGSTSTTAVVRYLGG